MSIQSEIERIEQNVANTYDALEEQGATMPTQKNSNNLAATARTIPTGGSGGTTVQADLAVNDPSNARYVKNRTHWKEEYNGPEGDIIPETTLQFKGSFNFGTLSGGNGGIQLGGLYIVTHNGTEYRCVAMDSGDGAYIGNGNLLGYGDLKDTGEPFCILGLASTVFTFYKPDKTAETITVKVVGVKETVWHKLDKGYLDEALQFGSEMGEILPETTVEIDPDEGSGGSTDVLDVIAGNAYTVKYNGVEYACTAQPYEEDGMTWGCILGNLAVIGGDDTGEPFMLLCFTAEMAAMTGVGYGCWPLDGSETVTLSITGGVVKKLDGKYLPEGYPRIKNSAEVLPETSFDFSESSDLPLDAISLTNGKWYAINWNGIEYRCQAKPFFMEGMLIGTMIGFSQVENYDGSVLNADEPFVIMSLDPSMVEMFGSSALITNIGTGSAVVASVRELDCQPLSPAYQPEMVVWFTYVYTDDGRDCNCTASRSYEEMRLAHEKGVKITGRVIVYVMGIPSVANLTLVMWTDTAMRFQSIFTANPAAFAYVEVTVGNEIDGGGFGLITYSGVSLAP